MNLFTSAVKERLDRSDPVRSLISGVGLGTLLQNLERSVYGPELKAGTFYFVDATLGYDGNNGFSWEEPFKTLQYAVNLVSDHDTIFVRGDIAESVSTPVAGGAAYVKIIGVQALGVPFENEWSSGGTLGQNTSPCLIIRTHGWHVEGFKFIVPDGVEAVRSLHHHTDALAYDASGVNWAYRSKIIRCQFYGATGGNWGKCGIRLYGAEHEMEVSGCYFSFIHQGAGDGKCIQSYDTGFAPPFRCRIIGNIFIESDAFIDTNGMNGCMIMGNLFQGTGKAFTGNPKLKINVQGVGNMIAGNFFGGAFTNTGGYWPSAGGDDWMGNYPADGTTNGCESGAPQAA